jgi:hypothetical protein
MKAAAIAVRERPIILSAPAVRALLDGRKTQTRRVVRWNREENPGYWPFIADGPPMLIVDCNKDNNRPLRCPYGQPGDRLYVKEAWGRGPLDLTGGVLGAEPDEPGGWPVYYRADGERDPSTLFRGRWRAPRSMPSWASRITLEIAGVSVERLQSITKAEAKAEGVDPIPAHYPAGFDSDGYIAEFARLWGSTHGKKPGCSWAANPWVWVLDFRRIEP